MIILSPLAQIAAPPSIVAVRPGTTSRNLKLTAVGGPSSKIVFKGEATIQEEIKAPLSELQEHFDWSKQKLNREFKRLQQKVLAGKSTADESKRYRRMKRDRTGAIFADKYVRDYAEVERLKVLSQKLSEIQQYLMPIKLG